MKISEYPPVEVIEDDDLLILETENGTKKASVQDLSDYIKVETYVPWVAHRNVFRGKNLGSTFTNEQKEAISNGSFDDLYVGDYWEINGVKWRIADINYWLKTGDTPSQIGCTTNHLVIVPDTTVKDATPMNSTNITTGGYVGSDMYKTHLNSVKQNIFSIFGQNNVLNHREYLINAVTNTYSSGGAWFDSTVELMNQIMVYGSNIYPQISGTTIANNVTIDKTQLALFDLRPDFITIQDKHYWLRDVVSSATFADVAWNGYAYHANASYSNLGVRPVFGLI